MEKKFHFIASLLLMFAFLHVPLHASDCQSVGERIEPTYCATVGGYREALEYCYQVPAYSFSTSADVVIGDIWILNGVADANYGNPNFHIWVNWVTQCYMAYDFTFKHVKFVAENVDPSCSYVVKYTLNDNGSIYTNTASVTPDSNGTLSKQVTLPVRMENSGNVVSTEVQVLDCWFEATSCPNSPSNATLTITDSSTAHGTRSTDGTLYLVYDGQQRSAAVHAIGCFPSGYPIWQSGVNAAPGSLQAALVKSAPSSGPILVQTGPNSSKTVYYNVIDDDDRSFTVSGSSSYVQEFTDSVNSIIGAVTGKAPAFQFDGGAASFEVKRVDKYNSPDYGYAATASGELKITIAEIDAEFPPIPIAAGVTAEPQLNLSGFEVKFKGSGGWDQSLPSTSNTVQITVTGSTTVSAGVEIIVGYVCGGATASGSMGLSISLSGPGSGFPDHASATGSFSASGLVGSFTAFVGPSSFNCQVWEEEYTFPGSSTSFSGTVNFY